MRVSCAHQPGDDSRRRPGRAPSGRRRGRRAARGRAAARRRSRAWPRRPGRARARRPRPRAGRGRGRSPPRPGAGRPRPGARSASRTSPPATASAQRPHRRLPSASITPRSLRGAGRDDDADQVEGAEVDVRGRSRRAASTRAGWRRPAVDAADRHAGDVGRAVLAAPGDDGVALGRAPRTGRPARGRGCRRSPSAAAARAGSRPHRWSRRRPPTTDSVSTISSTVAVVRVTRRTRPTRPSSLSTVWSGRTPGGGAGVDGDGAGERLSGPVGDHAGGDERLAEGVGGARSGRRYSASRLRGTARSPAGP